ncbi:MAG: cation-translocating P-type ATPase, partial [Muribaculaceae bacterium]|nr:cation-translocating P-type ATPase [Muribaculaceae bacterium]
LSLRQRQIFILDSHMDKQRLVRLLQQRDEVVAVTGDGTNDAPALKAAHVGLSMGDGTSVAKEASDITILDNSFANITRAVMWGRSLYRNIQRFLIFQLSISFTACLIVFIGSIMGADSPLTVTQMLYVNLIMDTFAAAAFASLPPNPDVMRDAPRRAKSSIITHPMWKWIMVVTVAFTAAITVMFITMRKDGAFSTYDSTLIFATFIMLQFWSMWNAKAFLTRKSSLHGLRESRMFIAVAVIILVGLVLIVTYGGSMFNTAPISLCDWIKIFVLTSPVFIVGEMARLIQRLAK